MPNSFTTKIHEQGYTLAGFLTYWRMTERTYRRWCADENKHEKLNKMIEGLR